MKFFAILVFAALTLSCAACDAKLDPAAKAPTSQPAAAPTPPSAVPFAGVAIRSDGTVIAGPGQSVEIIDDRVGPAMSRQDSASARGANLDAIGQEVKQSSQQDPSRVTLGGLGEDGLATGGSIGVAGGSSTEQKLLGVPQKQAGLYLFGALLVAGGIALLVYGLKVPGLATIAAGVGLLICGVLLDQAPWVFIVAGIVGMVWVGYIFAAKAMLSRSASAASRTLPPLVLAIEDFGRINPAGAGQLKSLINYHTDRADEATVKSTISAVKSQVGIRPDMIQPSTETTGPGPEAK